MRDLRQFFLVIILFVGFNFQNCGDEEGYRCECGTVPFFDVNGFELAHYSAGIYYTEKISNDSISFNNYRFTKLDYTVDYLSCRRNETDVFDIGFTTMSAAYGCSCLASGFNGAKTEGLNDLTIITLNDFSENYLAKDTINDIIEFYDNSLLKDPKTLDEFVSQNSNLIERKRKSF